jgi:hypothetical protein
MLHGELGAEEARAATRALAVVSLLPHLDRAVKVLEASALPRPEDVCVSIRALARRHHLAVPARRLRTLLLVNEVRDIILPRY